MLVAWAALLVSNMIVLVAGVAVANLVAGVVGFVWHYSGSGGEGGEFIW